MPQYRFVVIDGVGVVKRGTMSAASRNEAVARLERSGYQVRELEADEAGPPPRSRGPMDLPDDDEPARPARVPRGASPVLPLILSLAALLLGGTALGLTLFRKPPELPPAPENPLGKGLSAYDFKTPEAAIKSLALIDKDRDIKARIDLNDLIDGRTSEEKVRTLEIDRTADYNDYKILFVSYTRKGKKVKRVESFAKDPESKLWVPKYVSSFDVRKTNEQLGKDMEAWPMTPKDD